MKRWSSLVSALVSLGMLAAVSAGAADEDVVKIGAIFAVTGPASNLGAPEAKTAEMLVEQINAAGGVNVGGKKRPFAVEVIDTRDLEPGVPVSEALLGVEKLILEKKADFIVMFRASNDEVTETAATKQGIKLKRIYMKDTGLNIYGSGLIVKEEDVKRRPDMIRAYVEGTMEGLRYARDHQDEALQILLKHKPELGKELTRIQLKNAIEEVFVPPESRESGFGYMKADIMEKTVGITNEYFDGARKVSTEEAYTNQFIRK